MQNNEPQKNEAIAKEAVDNRIAAVRDLIFGENIQKYTEEFDDVYQRIKELKEQTSEQRSEMNTAIEKRISDLENSFNKSLENLTIAMNKRMDDLDDKKADRRKLGKALEKIAQTLQA